MPRDADARAGADAASVAPRRDDAASARDDADARVRFVWCPTRAALARAVARAACDDADARAPRRARAFVVASSASAALDATRAIGKLAKTRDAATATTRDARRLALELERDGAGTDARARRLDATRAMRATIARARRADACVVDVEDGEDGAEATARVAAAMERADGERIVFVRSPLACAYAREKGGDVDEDGTTRDGAILREMVTREETRGVEDEASAEALFGNAWPNDFEAREGVCKFHNYARGGCEAVARGGGACALNHDECAYCGEDGHRAYDCERLAEHERETRVRLKPSVKDTRVKTTHEDYRERLKRARATTTQPYVYVLGGRNRGLTVGVVERYDVLKNRWERAPTLVEPRGSHGACAVNSTIYVVSGGGIKSNLSSMETLDAANDAAWTLVEDVVRPRHAMGSAATKDGKIYTVGGWFNGSEALATNDVYDCATKTWRAGAEISHARRLHGVCATDANVFVFGGMLREGIETDLAERYDPVTDSWTPIAPLPSPACATACAEGSDCFVFAWGTSDATKRAKSVASSGGFYRYDTASDRYEDLGALPLKQWFGFTACAHDGVLYAIGGIVDGRWTGRAFAYHIRERAWEELASMSYVRRRTAAVCVEI